MFSVFMNKKEKKKTVKVPKSPWLFYYPHPTKKKSTKKRAEENKRNQEWSQVRMGAVSPVQYVLKVTERERLLSARKGVGRNGKGGRVTEGF